VTVTIMRVPPGCRDRFEVTHPGEPAERVDAELRAVGEQDAPPGRRDGRGLDGGDGGVRGGEAALDADPVGAEEREVDEQVVEHAGGPVVDGAEGAAADPAAQHQQVDVGARGEGHGGGQRVGDDGQRPVQREQVHQPLGGRALVQVDRLGIFEQVEGGLAEPGLLVAHGDRPGGEGTLEAEALDRDRPAVHPPQQPVGFQGVEVTADGLDGDVEFLGDLGDIEPAGGAGALDKPLPPFFGEHPCLLHLDGAARLCPAVPVRARRGRHVTPM
jgi:hypothetical protein